MAKRYIPSTPKSIWTSGSFPHSVQLDDMLIALVRRFGSEFRIPFDELQQVYAAELDFDSDTREVIVRVKA
jgi:hypothetical protein